MSFGMIDEPKAWISNLLGQYLKTKTNIVDELNNPVTVENGALNIFDGGMVMGVNFDDLQTTYPTTTTEEYEYLLATVTVKTIEVTYTDATKENFLRAREIWEFALIRSLENYNF